MKFLIALAASTAAIALAPAQANATALLFQVSGANGNTNAYSFSFTLDSNPVPSFVGGPSTRFAGTPITFTVPGSTTAYLANAGNVGPTFFLGGADSGGLAFLPLPSPAVDTNFRLFGPQIFTGTVAAPAFAPGTFNLSTIQPPLTTSPLQVNYQLRISTVGAVPEPATWATMIAGFALAAVALRRRRPVLAAA